jgi:transketolase
VKGKGISIAEGKDNWHGKALKKGEEMDRAVAELERGKVPAGNVDLARQIKKPASRPADPPPPKPLAAPSYRLGDQIATREAYGSALVKLGESDVRVVALDADVKNSTFSDKFEKAFPERLYENFIAEQVMVGSAMGLAARGAIPFPSTFACFLTRAADFIRMAAISNVNIKLAGSHAGVSIGEDGPSQMALEDIASIRAIHSSTVLHPCDANQTAKLVVAMADTKGIVFLRTLRPNTPVIYDADEEFRVGGSRVIRSSDDDDVTLVGAGITVHEALKAADALEEDGLSARVIDLYSIKPVDAETLQAAAEATGRIVTVEDHFPEGGVGDAVLAALAENGERARVVKLAVSEMPRSGKPAELLSAYGIDAEHIAAAARQLVREPIAAS